jgi:prepilin-type N-terminal cleavage/methylation domain-containing protein
MLRTRRSHASGGFSLTELLAVMVMLVILAGVAVPALSNLDDTRASMAAKHLHRDLTFARQNAVATGRITWVKFDTTGSTSWDLEEEDPGTPGKANALAMTDPATGGNYTQVMDSDPFYGVTVVSASFTGTDVDTVPDIGFDWIGRPLTKDSISLSGVGAVTLTGGYVVNVEPGTGYAEYVAP